MSKKCPRILYRYMRADHALSLLKDPWLKITPPVEFNDPNELTARASKKSCTLFPNLILSDCGSRSQAANIFNQLCQGFAPWHHIPRLKQSDLRGFAENNRKLWQAFVKLYERALYTDLAQKYLRIASSCHGVACFSENPRNRLMWAHYADSFKGAVIGFDTQSAFFRENPLKRMVYSESKPVFPKLRLSASNRSVHIKPPKRWSRVDFLSGMGQLMRAKDVAFRHEKEWRIYLLLANCRKRRRGMFFRRIPRVCIREIIIGPRCDPKLRREFLKRVAGLMPRALVKTFRLDEDGYELLDTLGHIPE